MSPNLLLYGVAPVSVSLSLKQQEDSSQQDDLTDWCFWAFWIDSSSLSVRNRGEDHHFPRQQRRSGICHHNKFRKSVRTSEIYAVNIFFLIFNLAVLSVLKWIISLKQESKTGTIINHRQINIVASRSPLKFLFLLLFISCWKYKLHVTNARRLKCRWTPVNMMPMFISPSVDIRQAGPGENSPPKLDASMAWRISSQDLWLAEVDLHGLEREPVQRLFTVTS